MLLRRRHYSPRLGESHIARSTVALYRPGCYGSVNMAEPEPNERPDVPEDADSLTSEDSQVLLTWLSSAESQAELDSWLRAHDEGGKFRDAFEVGLDWLQALEVPRDFGFTVRIGSNDAWDLHVRLTAGPSGPICHRLVIEPAGTYGRSRPSRARPPGITSTMLKDIPLTRLIQERIVTIRQGEGYLAQRAKEYVPPRPGSRVGRRGLSDAHYEWVAREYLAACAEDPRRPIVRLCARLGPAYPRPTISSWVDEARSRGFLTEPGQGRPGGSPGPRFPVLRTKAGVVYTRSEFARAHAAYVDAARPYRREITEAMTATLLEGGVRLAEFEERLRELQRRRSVKSKEGG